MRVSLVEFRVVIFTVLTTYSDSTPHTSSSLVLYSNAPANHSTCYNSIVLTATTYSPQIYLPSPV